MDLTILKQWVAEGQYEYPKAIQYGGDCLQPGPDLLLNWLDKNLSKMSSKFGQSTFTRDWGQVDMILC